MYPTVVAVGLHTVSLTVGSSPEFTPVGHALSTVLTRPGKAEHSKLCSAVQNHPSEKYAICSVVFADEATVKVAVKSAKRDISI